MDGSLSAAMTRLGRTADDDAAWQDGLDFLAAAAGLKPVAMFGRGGGDAEFFRALAREFSLPAIETTPWDPADPENILPRWYLHATAARRARGKILLVAREVALLARAEEMAAKGRVAAAEEAAILGYPPCCVAAHHAAALGVERAIAERVARANGGDEARCVRLVAAGATPFVPPPPIAPSRWTSVNLCAPCAADAASPAMRLERAYADLARRRGYQARP